MSQTPTLADLMALMEQSHKDVLGHLDDMNRQLNDVTEDHCTLLGSVNLALTSLDSKANSTEIKCLDQRIKTMATNLATMICEGMESDLSSLCTAVDKITDLKANLSNITKKLIPDVATETDSRFTVLQLTFDARPSALKQWLPTAPNNVPADYPAGSKPAHDAPAGTSTTPIIAIMDNKGRPPQSNGGSTLGTVTALAVDGVPATSTMAEDSTYVLPTGHFGLGLGRPSTPIHSVLRHGAPVAMDTISNTWHAYKESRQQCLAMGPPANPYTPMQLPHVDTAMSAAVGVSGDLGHNCTHSPCLGGPILSPWQQKDWTP